MQTYKDFSKDIWNRIHSAIEEARLKNLPKIAAFDADGTLWDNDAGNSFFNFEIENKLIPLPDDPWKHVYAMKAKNPVDAFLWLAQIHKGLPISTVKEWAQKSYEKQAIQYFPAIEKLIRLLKDNEFEVYVITASVKWAVEPCVKKLGITEDYVLGFQTQVHNGIITDIQAGHSTYKQGKIQALLEKTQNKKPILSCGNTMGDFWLLEAATHVPLAVRSISDNIKFQDKDINAQEMKLFEQAQLKNWLTHNFI
jgi:HAD superfamily phosphoserine phosphatase-like hydrolase